jgi:hypothetical protein
LRENAIRITGSEISGSACSGTGIEHKAGIEPSAQALPVKPILKIRNHQMHFWSQFTNFRIVKISDNNNFSKLLQQIRFIIVY